LAKAGVSNNRPYCWTPPGVFSVFPQGLLSNNGLYFFTNALKNGPFTCATYVDFVAELAVPSKTGRKTNPQPTLIDTPCQRI
jgi:hypothetical protein